MKVDLTNEDEVKEQWLAELKVGGLPGYAIYLPDGTIDVLPQVITPGMVAERLKQAQAR